MHYSIRGREREGSALAQALGGSDGALGCCCNVLLPGNYACKGGMLSSGQLSGASHQSVISGCSAGPQVVLCFSRTKQWNSFIHIPSYTHI